LLEQGNSRAELLLFVFGQNANHIGQRFHAAFARLPHKANAFGCCFEADAPAVIGRMAADHSRALEAGDDAAHCRRTDLLSVGKFAERLWSTEDEDGESGKLGGTDVGFAVADAKSAEQVDGGGVKLVGDFGRDNLGRGADPCGGDLKRMGAFAGGGERGNCSSHRRGCRCGRGLRSGEALALVFFGLDRRHGR
jgi:hypothetical protein